MPAARPPTPLLERDGELARLERAWRATRSTGGSAWLICAEAGGGKTRLMREFARTAGASVRWGAAEPLTPPEPYQAVLTSLPGLEPAETRAKTVERFVERLGRDARDGPMVCVLDDLHFGDDGTVAALTRLAAECARRPWLLLAAFRPEEGSEGLRLAATELQAQGHAQRLDLPPLSREAVGTLVSHVAGQSGHTDADTVYADSGGNPWLAEALARGGTSVAAVRNRIVLKLDRLEAANPGAFALLCSLSPATRPLPHAVVAAVAGGDSRALRRTLTELRDAGMLVESDDGWQFRHEILRRSLLEAMIGAERRDAHRALADALEQQGGGVAELAMHFAAARDPRAVDWALRAAAAARAVDAHAEALAQLERVLDFDVEPELRRQTLQQAAMEAYDLGRLAENQRFAEAAIAVPGGEPETLAQLHRMAGRAAVMQGRLEEDEAHLAAAERLLEGRPVSPVALSVAAARCARASYNGQPERLAAAATRALALTAQLEEPRARAQSEAQVTSFLVLAGIDAGDPAAFELLDEVVSAAQHYGLEAGVWMTALTNAYEGAVVSLFHSQTPALLARVWEGVRAHKLRWETYIEPFEELELVQRGRYAEALTLAQRSSPPQPSTLFACARVAATVLREARAGSLQRARSALKEFHNTTNAQERALMLLAALEVALAAQDDTAAGPAQKLYSIAEPAHYARAAGVAMVALTRCGQDVPATPPWLVADSVLHVFWRWAQGIAAKDAGLLRAAAAALAEIACPYEAALALRDAGDLTAAYRLFRDLEATTAREQTASMLRAAGLPIPRHTRAAGAPGGLTDTEREVTRRVVAGATNEQVAAALGISAYTVATHLTHIYAKAAVRGRAGLIAWWGEQRAATG